MNIKSLLFAAAISVFPSASLSATIEPGIGGSTIQVQYFSPVGQSFLAEDQWVDIDLYLTPINAHIAPAPVTASLYGGLGASGPVLHSASATPTTGSSGYVKFFDDVSLDVGDVYTVLFSSGSAYWGTRLPGDTYGGGTAFINGTADPSADLAVRITPQAAPVVPLPAAGWMLLASLLGFAAWRRRTVTA